MIQGLGNKFRVYILKKDPVYTKEDLDRIASKHISPLPSCLTNEKDGDKWRKVYYAFVKAGLSTQRASEETDHRIIWYD
jgi:hypothetical protein